jgi:hypothetical protein
MGTFDRALFDALVAVGVPADRDERYGLHAQVLATRRDVAELEARLVREMAEGHTRLMREVAECNVRIADTKSDLARWVLAALTAQTALIVGAMKLL